MLTSCLLSSDFRHRVCLSGISSNEIKTNKTKIFHFRNTCATMFIFGRLGRTANYRWFVRLRADNAEKVGPEMEELPL